MKLTRKDIEYVINESIKKITLSEGIANQELRRLAKIHGGIENVRYNMNTNRIPLDKWKGNASTKIWCFPNPYYIKFTKYRGKEFKNNPNAAKEFQSALEVKDLLQMNKLKHLVSFNDGYEGYISNTNDPEIQDELSRLENELDDLQGKRLSDYADGKTFYNDKYKDFLDANGDWDSISTGKPDLDSPRDAEQKDRISAHKSARGKKLALGKGDSADYNKYVRNYLEQTARKYGLKKDDWSDSYVGMLNAKQQEEALSDFAKVGYARDDSKSDWTSLRNNPEKPTRFGVCKGGKTYYEWDDPGFGPDGYVRGPESPKIGYKK